MLFRIIAVVMVLAIAIFCFKDKTFEFLLAPSQWDFVTYRYIEKFLHRFFRHIDFGDGIGISVACDSLLLGKVRSGECHDAGTIPQIRFPRHHGGSCCHHPT